MTRLFSTNSLCFAVFLFLFSCGKGGESPDPQVSAGSLIGKWEYIEAYGPSSSHLYYEFTGDGMVRESSTIGGKSDLFVRTFAYVVEGQMLRFRYSIYPEPYPGSNPPKKDECRNLVLPKTMSDRITCIRLEFGFCVYESKGTESFSDFTLVKQ